MEFGVTPAERMPILFRGVLIYQLLVFLKAFLLFAVLLVSWVLAPGPAMLIVVAIAGGFVALIVASIVGALRRGGGGWAALALVQIVILAFALIAIAQSGDLLQMGLASIQIVLALGIIGYLLTNGARRWYGIPVATGRRKSGQPTAERQAVPVVSAGPQEPRRTARSRVAMRPVLVVALILAILAAGCTSPPPEEPGPEDDTPTDPAPPPPPPAVSLTVRTTGNALVLVAPIGFDPDTLSAASGANVTITFQNEDLAAPHGWVLEGVDGAAIGNVDAGETDTVTFSAPVPGTYAFYCPVGDHRERGQEGTFTVTA